MNSIEISSLTKVYKRYQKNSKFYKNFFDREYEKKCAIDNFDLSINEGEIIGLLGQNGAGKTTLIKMMAGILEPTEGKISIAGFNPSKRENQFKQCITLVLGQKAQMWWDVTAMDSFLLNKSIYGISDIDFDETINEMIKLFDVKDLVNKPVRSLSLGERMKCELICALIHKPKIVFLDEPTIGLDVVVQENMRRFILNYRNKHKATIILTSHYMEDIEKLCDRVIFIEQGKKYYDGTLMDFVGEYGNALMLNIEIKNNVNVKWCDYGEVINVDNNKVKIIVPKKEAMRIKSVLSLIEGVQSVQTNDIDAAEIVRKHFEMRKNP